MRGIGFEAVETSIDENTRLSRVCVRPDRGAGGAEEGGIGRV